jgi:hypothetical protein
MRCLLIPVLESYGGSRDSARMAARYLVKKGKLIGVGWGQYKVAEGLEASAFSMAVARQVKEESKNEKGKMSQSIRSFIVDHRRINPDLHNLCVTLAYRDLSSMQDIIVRLRGSGEPNQKTDEELTKCIQQKVTSDAAYFEAAALLFAELDPSNNLEEEEDEDEEEFDDDEDEDDDPPGTITRLTPVPYQPSYLCRICNKPTGRSPQARYCETHSDPATRKRFRNRKQ